MNDLTQIYERLGRIETGLDEHMRRTAALEALHADLHARVTPIEAHVAAWAGAGKLLAVLISLAGLAVAILRALG